jgi:SAM-dependent methyltransferase
VTREKFGPNAAWGWTEYAYADPAAYLEHRAELIRLLGPPLAAGDRVLDLACGDGGLAEHLLPHGLSYVGVDASPAMVAAARARLAGRAEILEGTIRDFRPDAAVAATTIFRSLHYVEDRPAFFRRVRDFTDKKLVFDLSPRRYRLETIRAELLAAGFERIRLRPFFVPQTRALPRLAQRALVAAELSGPPARLLLRFRFTYVCAAAPT